MMSLADKIKNWLGVPEAKLDLPGDLANGDYSTNLALVLKKDAAILKQELERSKPSEIAEIKVVPPGFINFYLSEQFLNSELNQILAAKNDYGHNERLAGQKIIIEYTDPNPFKEFHIGHLMSNTIGEALSRLAEFSGAEVKRACYQGDVGLHVAKALWAGGNYALGSEKYDESEAAKKEIQELNKKIYAQSDPEINQKYQAGKKASLAKFEAIYKKLGTKFDYYFLESETGEFGKKIVEQNIGKIFAKSEKAVVFHAENYDQKLHTRVFLTSDGLPTYEAKELGLAKIKFAKYPYDQSLVVTGNEINQYFKVLLAAMKLVFPDLAAKTKHISHGMLRLSTGKMSSRTGDIITAESFISEIQEKTKLEEVAVAAIKYEILKQAPGRDIVFDINKSVSLVGDSGPYLQYTYARAKSVLEKANYVMGKIEKIELTDTARFLVRFPDIVSRASEMLAPQLLVHYLLELAGSFNHFYAQNKIIGSEEEKSRLALTAALAQVLQNGLWLLGIAAPEKM